MLATVHRLGVSLSLWKLNFLSGVPRGLGTALGTALGTVLRRPALGTAWVQEGRRDHKEERRRKEEEAKRVAAEEAAR